MYCNYNRNSIFLDPRCIKIDIRARVKNFRNKINAYFQRLKIPLPVQETRITGFDSHHRSR